MRNIQANSTILLFTHKAIPFQQLSLLQLIVILFVTMQITFYVVAFKSKSICFSFVAIY
jgi:hypothetical protein